ncbi:hypothetical protein HA052_18310 [Chromobacterium haemolyticum]|uniref:Uncharacterized protein n=1 Tax=Chromobacterium fluminis TaxID=3044269 RepID=A0ABX0L5S0_9NEIS|nr:hypothetical protein [Chromobacterium haemolyticum]NHR07149.1 hypothetical protein [Chromobacterium haemolyticum]
MLNRRLSDISASELGAYRLEGIVPQGPNRRGPWSSFDWVFTRPDGVLLVLSEWDFVADGGGVLALREDMNMSVRGHPARFQLRTCLRSRELRRDKAKTAEKAECTEGT